MYQSFGVACYLHLQGIQQDHSEDGDSKLLRNVGTYMTLDMALYNRTVESSPPRLWEFQMS
jgi:hypothetical protein